MNRLVLVAASMSWSACLAALAAGSDFVMASNDESQSLTIVFVFLGSTVGLMFGFLMSGPVPWQWTPTLVAITGTFLLLNSDRREFLAYWIVVLSVVALWPVACGYGALHFGSVRIAAAVLLALGLIYFALGWALGILFYPILLIPHGLWLIAAGLELKTADRSY